MVKANDRFPSFLYAMSLAKDELFLEETILVTRPGGSSRDLQVRLKKRMDALGIEAIEVLEDERAAIPMGGADPVIPQRTLGFGATNSFVHPASGYMVARAMEVAPRVAANVSPEIRKLRAKFEEGNLDKKAFDEASAAGWQAVWPADERRQRDFMNFGFELLCFLNPQELRDFFIGFFRLPNGLWEHFLSWRLSGVGHIVMGVTVCAQCIPRRFMPTMLIKSLPFLADKLVLPFASRGGSVFTESAYWDARSGNSTLWEPESYFPYVESLYARKYDAEVGSETLQQEPSKQEAK
jgi:lycopene beta-cyclase